MPKDHRKWIALIGYNDCLNEGDYKYYKSILETHDNVLIMIKKMQGEDPERREKVFKQLCDRFPKETKTGKLIISKVPDITYVLEVD